MRHCATCALMYFITMTCGIQTAQAQPNSNAMTTLTTRAQTAFARGQLDEAIRLYLQAYNTVDQDPSLLYNVAFIYEQTGRVKAAGDMYRQVARATRSSPALRVKAYERRDQLPAVRPTIPLLEASAPVRAPVRPPPVRAVKRAPATSAPVAPPVRVAAPRTARPKAAPSAAPAAPTTEEEPINRRLSPEQRRRLELRRRRARAKKGR